MGRSHVRYDRLQSTAKMALLAIALGVGGCAGNAAPPQAPPGAPVDQHQAARRMPTPVEQQASVSAAGPSGESGLSGAAKEAYDLGFRAWSRGDLNGAKAAFVEAASRASEAAGPKYSLGCVLERLGDTQGALDAYRAASAANDKYDPAAGAYALLLARTGRGADAEQFLTQRSRTEPDSARLMTYWAEVKSIEGDSPGCQQMAQAALAKQPGLTEAMIVIARDYYRSHRWDLARYALQAILDGADDGSIPPRDKGNPQALLLRGLIEREVGQRKQAISAFEQAVAKRPDLFEANVNLGEMKLEAGNATEAEGPLEKAAAYGPNVGVVHLDLGDCYRLLGRPTDAKKELDAALNADSTLAGAHYDLGLLYLFSPTMPGVSSEDDQLTMAVREFENYKSMRGAKAPKGQGDDVEELLSTAKRKQTELQVKKQAAASAGSSGGGAPPSAADGGAP